MRKPVAIVFACLCLASVAQYTGGTGGGGSTSCSAAFQWLPVELLHFSAMPSGDRVRLQWATASELNNAGFQVERSGDGVRFDVVVEIEGMGTTPLMTEYETVDSTPLAGLSYYRLRQTDLDGTTTYSDAIAVTLEAITIRAFPNPVRSVLAIQGVMSEGPLHMEVFDGRGRPVRQRTVSDGVLEIDMNDLPVGLYRVRVSWPQGSATLPIVKE